MERTENVRFRDLVDANGRKVDGHAVARKALRLAANPGFLKEIGAYIASDGKRGAGSKTAVYLREALEAGFGGSRRMEMLPGNTKDLAADIANATSKPRKAFAALGHVVHQWNATFDSGAPLAIYIAMRESGMTAKQAAFQTKDLMNFRKQGSTMGLARMIWAFAQPAVTGGHQLYKTLSTRGGLVRAGGYIAAFIILKGLLASLAGDDDELDKNQLDLLDEFTKDRALPIPMPGGGIAKLPVGFGLPMFANAFAQVLRESPAGTGDSTWGKTAEDLVTRALLTQVSPLEDSKIDSERNSMSMLIQTLAPTAAAPVLNVAINKGAFGQDISKVAFQDENRPLSAQGSPFTADFYRDVAKFVYANTGIDFAPEQLRELVVGYTPGAFGMARKAVVDNPNSETLGRETNVPLLDRFYIGANPSKLYSAIGDFDSKGMKLMRKVSSTLPPELTGKSLMEAVQENINVIEDETDRATLRLYLDYIEDMNGFKSEARALTRAGVAKGINAERAALREAREEVQRQYLNQWFRQRD